jgi:putative colanic acid biosynthesis UDP-glucose lipid carrier transferase
LEKNIQESFKLLPYLPFWFFEWGSLFVCSLYTLKPTFLTNNNTTVFYVLVSIWLLGGILSRFYNYERNLNFTKQLQRFILFSIFWAAFFYLATLFFSDKLVWNTLAVINFTVSLFLIKALAVIVLFKLRKSVPLFQEKILVCNGDSGTNFIKDARDLKRTGFNIYEADKRLFEETSFDQLEQTIQENNIQSIYVPLDIVLDGANAHILNLNWNKQVRVKFITSYNSPITGRNAHFYGLTQVVSHHVSPLDSILYRILKRLFDIVFSGLVIAGLLSWFTPLMAVLIWADSKGPLFFIQKRPGRFKKPFSCIKFRSMTVNNRTEKSATRNDARVTRVGRVIRNSSLDELPQFFNVFFGQMSIVGPRPNLTSQNNQYSKIFDDYSKRMYLKPGITGLAQVSGARGGIDNDIEMKHRIKYDIFYIRNWSFALDIKIIIRTVLNIIRGEEKAY